MIKKKIFFSKSYSGLVNIKKDLFSENHSYLKKGKKEFQNYINEHFYEHIDKMQNVLDKGKSCSEVHIVLKNKNLIN